jgi:DNA-binding transcriptional MerR regulator
MRSGELSKLLGISDQTLLNWMSREELKPYLSPSALGEAGNSHRIYTENDVLVLNSVRSLRVNNVSDWAEIAKTLQTGWRDQEFPQNAISRDDRLIPIPQAKQAAEFAAVLRERDAALAQIDDLKHQLADERTERKTLQERYEKLLREIGKLEGIIEMLRGQNSK